MNPPSQMGGCGLWIGAGVIFTSLRSKYAFFSVTVSPSRRRRTTPSALLVRGPALVEGYAEAFEFLELVASADSDLETPARNDVDHRDILGKAYRVVKRHQQHARRDADPLGASGDRSSGGEK